MEYWQKDIETMGRDQLQELQLTRLKETVKHAANSPFYKEVFEKNGITPDSIQTLDDFKPERAGTVRSVGITAGASTPNQIIEEVHTNVRIKF